MEKTYLLTGTNGVTTAIPLSEINKKVFSHNSFTLYGMDTKTIIALRRAYLAHGGVFPITADRVSLVFADNGCRKCRAAVSEDRKLYKEMQKDIAVNGISVPKGTTVGKENGVTIISVGEGNYIGDDVISALEKSIGKLLSDQKKVGITFAVKDKPKVEKPLVFASSKSLDGRNIHIRNTSSIEKTQKVLTKLGTIGISVENAMLKMQLAQLRIKKRSIDKS